MVRMSEKVPNEEEAKEAPIHGDILEKVLSHVPLLDLVPASHVSRSWNDAVFASLHHLITLKPWLVVHTQSTRSPYVTTTHAYDPRSNQWLELRQPPIKYVSTLRSSHSDLLYMLSPSKLSFSSDPLHLTWHDAAAPFVWRTDPIVAAVGHRIIVAGGTCDFEDDPLAVEIYDTRSGSWETCESMPAVLKDSAASTWLSIAASDRKLFVTEKFSGVTHAYDPETNIWSGPYDIRPEPSVFYSVIAFSDHRLILIGVVGDGDSVGVKLWEVNSDSESLSCEAIGEMPPNLIEKLKIEVFQIPSIGVCLAGNTAYIYNPADVEEIVMCELGDGGGCRWRSVKNAAASDRRLTERFVFTCSEIGIGDVRRALRCENLRFEVKTRDS